MAFNNFSFGVQIRSKIEIRIVCSEGALLCFCYRSVAAGVTAAVVATVHAVGFITAVATVHGVGFVTVVATVHVADFVTDVASVHAAGFVTDVEVSAASATISVFVTTVSAAVFVAAVAAATVAVLLCWLFCGLAAKHFLCINVLSCTLSSIF
jgi:hypothetical protein